MLLLHFGVRAIERNPLQSNEKSRYSYKDQICTALQCSQEFYVWRLNFWPLLYCPNLYWISSEGTESSFVWFDNPSNERSKQSSVRLIAEYFALPSTNGPRWQFELDIVGVWWYVLEVKPLVKRSIPKFHTLEWLVEFDYWLFPVWSCH